MVAKETTTSSNKVVLDDRFGLLLPMSSLPLAGRGGRGHRDDEGERRVLLLLPSYSVVRWSSARRLRPFLLFNASLVGAGSGVEVGCSLGDLLKLHRRKFKRSGHGGKGEWQEGAAKVFLAGEDGGSAPSGDSASSPAYPKPGSLAKMAEIQAKHGRPAVLLQAQVVLSPVPAAVAGF